jgi:hypothetical protein
MTLKRAGAALCGLCTLGLTSTLSAAVIPDPSDSFLTLVPTTGLLDAPSLFANMTALSGDGRTSLQNCFNQTYRDEFVIRDGTRTSLTHYKIGTSAPSRQSVSLPFDGSFVLANIPGKTNQAVLISLPGQVETPLPLQHASVVSANGAWVFGSNDGGISIERFRVGSGTKGEVIVSPADAVEVLLLRVSDDGSIVFGQARRPVIGPGEPRPFVWDAAPGFRWLSVPNDFVSAQMDGSGKVFVGFWQFPGDNGLLSTPALWTEAQGIVKLTMMMEGFFGFQGNARTISGDGRLIFGEIHLPPTESRMVVWTREGAIFGLKELIRGIDTGRLAFNFPTGFSHDGKTVVGTAFLENSPTNYIAGLALPGEGPQIRFKTATNGRGAFTFRAKAGFDYQPQFGTAVGQWTPLGSLFEGDDTVMSVELPDSDEATGFVRVLVKAQ